MMQDPFRIGIMSAERLAQSIFGLGLFPALLATIWILSAIGNGHPLVSLTIFTVSITVFMTIWKFLCEILYLVLRAIEVYITKNDH